MNRRAHLWSNNHFLMSYIIFLQVASKQGEEIKYRRHSLYFKQLWQFSVVEPHISTGQSNKGPRSNTDVIHFIWNNFNNFQFLSLIKVQGNQIRGPDTIISLLYTVFLQISQKVKNFNKAYSVQLRVNFPLISWSVSVFLKHPNFFI